MIKKFLVILIVFALILAGLQLFGGRDFTQIDIAWDKYSENGELGAFIEDVVAMFKGEKIREGALPNSRYADRVMYRWKDEFGQVNVSERKPATGDYEEIRLGDMDFDIQEGMTQEEINDILLKKKK